MQISQSVIQKVLNYLQTRPFNEVNGLINEVVADINAKAPAAKQPDDKQPDDKQPDDEEANLP